MSRNGRSPLLDEAESTGAGARGGAQGRRRQHAGGAAARSQRRHVAAWRGPPVATRPTNAAAAPLASASAKYPGPRSSPPPASWCAKNSQGDRPAQTSNGSWWLSARHLILGSVSPSIAPRSYQRPSTSRQHLAVVVDDAAIGVEHTDPLNRRIEGEQRCEEAWQPRWLGGARLAHARGAHRR